MACVPAYLAKHTSWNAQIPPAYQYTLLISGNQWPGTHPQPCEQGRTTRDQTGLNVYLRWLTSPGIHAWDDVTAVPVARYAPYMQQSWWTYTHQKFQHHGLRLSSNPQEAPSASLLLPRVPAATELNSDGDALVGILGQELYLWLRATILPLLERQGMPIIQAYLRAVMNAAAETTIQTIRFAVEENAW